MKEKIPCISFKFNSKLYIYPFLLPVVCMLTHFFQKIMFKNCNPKESFKILKYNFPLLFYYFLPKVFSFILVKIIKSNTKGEDIKGLNQIKRRYHSIIKNENSKKVLLIIFVISFLEVLFKAGDSVLMYLQDIKKINYLIEKRTAFIILVPLFSYLLLLKPLYKHHVIALFLELLGASVIILCRFFLGFSKFDEYLYHILNILFASLFSLSLVLMKYLMIRFLMISPYIFLFYDGIFCLINSFIIVFFEYPVIININDINTKFNSDEENKKFFSNNFLGIFTILFINQNRQFYISFLLSLIFSFGYFIFNTLTIYHFSPYLNVLTDFTTPFLYNILDFIFLDSDRGENNLKRYLWEFFGYIIIIFGSLILNELIILNFFGLNEYTYENICQRGNIDFTTGIYNGPDESINTITDIFTENETEQEANTSN